MRGHVWSLSSTWPFFAAGLISDASGIIASVSEVLTLPFPTRMLGPVVASWIFVKRFFLGGVKKMRGCSGICNGVIVIFSVGWRWG